MSRTITAFFDSRADAEAARQRLSQSNIDADRVQIIDQSSASSGTGTTGSQSEGGFWSSLKTAFLPEEDTHAYEEGMRRGGYLLCAQVDESQADQAIQLLDDDSSVDFDQRQDQWRSEGWSGYDRQSQTNGFREGSLGGGTLGTSGSQNFAGTERSGTVEEERIPIVEEQLRVGKREVAKGGARVRSYMQETPVHEQVNLREEHVSVERRPVDQTLSAGELNSGDLMRDRTIEMTETAEEAVVSKEARVAEEVVVRKTAEERVEQIEDTVRRTEVDVDEGLRSGSEDRSAFFKDGSSGTSGKSGDGTGATGFDSKREPAGSGYSDRIDKSGL